MIFSSNMLYRILLACIKYLANCLCPRCTVHKSEVAELGRKLDMRNRESKRREDSEKHQADVDAAREKIFKQGRGVESAAVKKVLDTESYTTTRVSLSVYSTHSFSNTIHRTHSHRSFVNMALLTFACTRPICFMLGV